MPFLFLIVCLLTVLFINMIFKYYIYFLICIFTVRDTFCSYGIVELCVRELAAQIEPLRDRGVQLSCLRTCVVVAEERPRAALCNTFAKLFSPLGLSSRAVSTSFGCRVNVAVCMQVCLCVCMCVCAYTMLTLWNIIYVYKGLMYTTYILYKVI